jgi:ABC-type multidrug transport system fused ATPase/permease subunit
VREWDLQALRRRIGVVLQDVFLFSGDVAGNISLGRSEVTAATIEAVARRVNVGLHPEPPGEAPRAPARARSISRPASASSSRSRALAYDAILVLDEATSSVDTETEMLIQDALTILMRDRTALVIAHRLSTIEHSDRIIVLHHGVIREIGTHLELIAARGIYHRLYELQYALADDAAAAS